MKSAAAADVEATVELLGLDASLELASYIDPTISAVKSSGLV